MARHQSLDYSSWPHVGSLQLMPYDRSGIYVIFHDYIEMDNLGKFGTPS
jgi:hypothetical protein